jgi:hypothetical protein
MRVVVRLLEEMGGGAPRASTVYSIDPRVYNRILGYEGFRSTLGLVLSFNPSSPLCHCRYIGRVTIYNIHGWNVGGHLVVHNGIVGAYLYEDGRGYSGTLELVT